MATTSRETLRSEAAKLIGGLAWSGTATGGSTTTLVHTGDGGLLDTGMSTYFFQGTYLLLTSSTDDGDWRMVREQNNGYAPTTGTITVGQAFTTGGANSTTYEILRYLDPTEWNECINAALLKLRYRYLSPITLITDGDMETSGTSDWTSSNTTLSKVTSGSFLTGTQCMRTANSGANGYGQSANVRCNGGDSFSAWVDYQATSGTAVLVAYDVTNSAEITTASGDDAGDNNEGGMISIDFTAPATCRNIGLRLQGTEATADINWDNCILMRSGRRRYDVPSWLTNYDMYISTVQRYGNRPFEYHFIDVSGPVRLEEEQTAVTLYRINLPDGTPRPYFIVGSRNYATLATDAATTNCQQEWAAYAVASEVLERYVARTGNVSSTRMESERIRINNRLAYLNRRLMPHVPMPAYHRMEWVRTN